MRTPQTIFVAFLTLLLLSACGGLRSVPDHTAASPVVAREAGTPLLTVNFSHLSNQASGLLIILNVTNIGTASAAIGRELSGNGVSEGSWGSHMTSYAVSPERAGWTILPPGTYAQVPFEPGWSTNFLGTDGRYAVVITYTDALATNSPATFTGNRYTSICADIPSRNRWQMGQEFRYKSDIDPIQKSGR